jgi:hypothetical protein
MTAQGWEYVTSLPAARFPAYSASVPSYGNTLPAPAPVTEIQVVARTAAGALFTSNVGSGTSVDNLAPAAPQSVTALRASDDAVVTWSAPSPDPGDLSNYLVYRGSAPDFAVGDASRIGAASTSVFVDPDPGAMTAYYRVTAVDLHENEGPASVAAMLPGATAVDGHRRLRTRIVAVSPNPFNPRTSIRFELAAAGHAELTVFDVRGRKVVDLVDAYRTAGVHVVNWDGSARGVSVASGSYFLRLQTDDEIRVVKLLLVK